MSTKEPIQDDQPAEPAEPEEPVQDDQPVVSLKSTEPVYLRPLLPYATFLLAAVPTLSILYGYLVSYSYELSFAASHHIPIDRVEITLLSPQSIESIVIAATILFMSVSTVPIVVSVNIAALKMSKRMKSAFSAFVFLFFILAFLTIIHSVLNDRNFSANIIKFGIGLLLFLFLAVAPISWSKPKWEDVVNLNWGITPTNVLLTLPMLLLALLVILWAISVRGTAEYLISNGGYVSQENSEPPLLLLRKYGSDTFLCALIEGADGYLYPSKELIIIPASNKKEKRFVFSNRVREGTLPAEPRVEPTPAPTP